MSITLAPRRHRHRAAVVDDRPFNGCVVWLLKDCEPRSHGHLLQVEVCSCGAERRTNVNGPSRETSGWVPRRHE